MEQREVRSDDRPTVSVPRRDMMAVGGGGTDEKVHVYTMELGVSCTDPTKTRVKATCVMRVRGRCARADEPVVWYGKRSTVIEHVSATCVN